MALLSLVTFVAIAASIPVAHLAEATMPVVVNSEVPARCNDPVYLVVWVENLDRTKSKAYGEALRSTGIVTRHGGKYLAVGAPLQLLEGSWPADRAFVLEQYPCVEALRKMWFSKEYQQKLVPLRAGSGYYTAAIMKTFKPAAAIAVAPIKP